MFQVVNTLAVLQDNYKGFRHNNLNPKNIYAYLKNQKIFMRNIILKIVIFI